MIRECLTSQGSTRFEGHVKYDADNVEQWETLGEGHTLLEEPAERWLRTGCKFVGSRLIREFAGVCSPAVVMCWLPASEDNPDLYKVYHDDGDYEEIDETELNEAIQRYVATQANSSNLLSCDEQDKAFDQLIEESDGSD